MFIMINFIVAASYSVISRLTRPGERWMESPKPAFQGQIRIAGLSSPEPQRP
jgi:hypothetical protein